MSTKPNEREMFEAWALPKALPIDRTNGHYDWYDVRMRWEGWQARAALSTPPAAVAQPTPCAGSNCGTTTAQHSRECIAEHAAAVAGGRFVKVQPVATWPNVPACTACGVKAGHYGDCPELQKPRSTS
jgi:hypothetical protein